MNGMNNNMYPKANLLTILSLAVHLIPWALLILILGVKIFFADSGILATLWLYSIPGAAFISLLLSVISLIFSGMTKKSGDMRGNKLMMINAVTMGIMIPWSVVAAVIFWMFA